MKKENKIPKVIHYCWLSNDPVPKQMQDYIDIWHRLMPDYEFIKWDFTRFDKASSAWVSEAFDNKKYAFAADYIRMYALYTMGGIYMDMDVEVLKPFDDLLDRSYFLCNERDATNPEVATFGVEKGCEWVRLMMEYYHDRHFILPDGSFDTLPLPLVTKKVLESHGYRFQPIGAHETPPETTAENKVIYLGPYQLFSPKSYYTGAVDVTEDTYSIHRFANTWIPWYQRWERKFWRALGCKPYLFTFYIETALQRFFYGKKQRK